MTRIAQLRLHAHPDLHFCAIRRTIDFLATYGAFTDECVPTLMAHFQANQALPNSSLMAVFYNTELTQLDLAIGFISSERMPETPLISATMIPAGVTAETIDQGPYEAQDPTLTELLEWVDQHGYTKLGPIVYEYLNDSNRPPATYLTRMLVPIQTPAELTAQ